MSSIRFRGTIRHWKQDPPGGLAVVDVPPERVADLGGRRQYRVEGSINGSPFAGSTMLVAGGGFAFGLSKATMKSAGVAVGDEVEVDVQRPRSATNEEQC
jgi:Domain of unknown function (DUF1905)